MSNVDINAVKTYLLGLQQTICSALQELDGGAQFIADQWQREAVVVALAVFCQVAV